MTTENVPVEVQAPSRSGTLSGIAGEYFVAAELSRRGHIASLTLRNTDGVDILAANVNATRSVTIQVKAKWGKAKRWTVGEKSEGRVSENHFFVFVNLNDGAPPSYHIVPSRTVAERIRTRHAQFIERGGNENSMRTFVLERPEEFLDDWNALCLKSASSHCLNLDETD